MQISFNINYHTNWGETLFLCGSIPELGNGDSLRAIEMKLDSPDNWTILLDTDNCPDRFDYWFIVKSPYKEWRFEWGKPHRFEKPIKSDIVKIFEAWQDQPFDKPYYSSAFVTGILNRSLRDKELIREGGAVLLRVEAPMIKPDEVLAITGETDFLGNWDPKQAIRLNDSNYPIWEINLPMSGIDRPFQYKFIIVRKKDNSLVAWETGNNRFFGFIKEDPKSEIIVNGLRFRNPRTDWKGAGTAIPVFSIRTEEDFGVGDFLDIIKMVDWCVMTGQKVLQILPVNDTTKTDTWRDSYPYSANSTFALHPIYIRLEAVGLIADEARMTHYRRIAQELNLLPEIDYETVTKIKNDYLHELFTQNSESDFNTDDYKHFWNDNRQWLVPYASWKVLREKYNSPDNSKWGEYASYNKQKVDSLCRKEKEKIEFEYFVQYHLDKQLREARDYAHTHGVILKGDIPIGIDRFSADAWQNPSLFNMDCQAGAPPDAFSIMGQNWGFPTYNWDVMWDDGFRWWKERLKKMADYFDAYRIDHILGFFRIWQIPISAVHGLLGYFNPALPFSQEELRQDYDFWINPEIHTKPLILEWMLVDFFGEYVGEVKENFIENISEGRYKLRPLVDTQRKVNEYFDKLENSGKNDRVRNGLLCLIDDVLFIEDPYKPGHYHPRITAQTTYQFRILNDYEKGCFNRLYNDFFYHRHNSFWFDKAMWKLPPLIDSTGMLACGEDLGMIPACVPDVMDRLEILSLEIQRMPKNPNYIFGDTWKYPYYSVCTTSTHDMGGIRQWWENDREITQKFYSEVLHEHGEAPYYAEPWICERIINLQLKSPSMFCILPLADWLSADGKLRRHNPNEEQINIPAVPDHYWRYRMHVTVESLLSATQFNNRMQRAIQASQR